MLTPDVSPRQSFAAIQCSAIHQKILDAAIDVFVELGFSHTSTNRIAKRAGISVGSIYRFYPNKFAIFSAIFDYYAEAVERITIDFLQSEDREKPWPERVDRYIDTLAQFYIDNPKLARAWTALSGTPGNRERDRQYNDRAIESFADYLASVIPDRPPADLLRFSTSIYWSTFSFFEKSVTGAFKLDKKLVDQLKVMTKAYVGLFVER